MLDDIIPPPPPSATKKKLISNDFFNYVQCGVRGYENAISPSFAGANFRALDSQSGKFILLDKHTCDNQFDIYMLDLKIIYYK